MGILDKISDFWPILTSFDILDNNEGRRPESFRRLKSKKFVRHTLVTLHTFTFRSNHYHISTSRQKKMGAYRLRFLIKCFKYYLKYQKMSK